MVWRLKARCGGAEHGVESPSMRHCVVSPSTVKIQQRSD